MFRNVVPFAFPAMLVATHMYDDLSTSPERAMDKELSLRTLTEPLEYNRTMSLPLRYFERYHVMLGVGNPSASHLMKGG